MYPAVIEGHRSAVDCCSIDGVIVEQECEVRP